MDARELKSVPFLKMPEGSGYGSVTEPEFGRVIPGCTGGLFCSDVAIVDLALSEQNEHLWFSRDFSPPGQHIWVMVYW